MGSIDLNRFVSLQSAIVAERQALLARLRKVEEALNAMGVSATERYYGRYTPTGRVRNRLSLKETVVEVLKRKPLTKEEILDAVLRSGYQFSTDNPMNSLGVVLYGHDPKFKNTNGRFSLK